jgi:hypothetical protein
VPEARLGRSTALPIRRCWCPARGLASECFFIPLSTARPAIPIFSSVPAGGGKTHLPSVELDAALAAIAAAPALAYPHGIQLAFLVIIQAGLPQMMGTRIGEKRL